MRPEATERLAKVASVPSVLRQTHVGLVKALISALALFGFRLRTVHRLPPLPNRAGEAEHENQGQGGAKAGQGALAPAPTPDVLETGDRSRLDWFIAQEAAKFVREFLRALVTTRRFLLQTFEANRFEVARNARCE